MNVIINDKHFKNKCILSYFPKQTIPYILRNNCVENKLLLSEKQALIIDINQ